MFDLPDIVCHQHDGEYFQSNQMIISIIVAMDRQGIIGMNYKLPWHLSSDLRYFKKITMGKPIIMGRKTHASIGRPLPGRENIILSADAGFRAEGCTVMNSLEQVFEYLKGREEIVFMGGADVYAQVLGRTDRIYLTEVHADVAGDTRFPSFDRSAWEEISRQDCRADEKNEYDYSFVILERSNS